MPGIGNEAFKIRANEVNFRKEAHLPTLINYMQEAAWNNAADLGFSVYTLLDNNVTWVIQRMDLEVQRLPVHGETVTVQTWPSGMDKYYVYRDFRVFVEAEIIAEASSRWLVFDVRERKMIAVPPFLIEAVPTFENDNLPREYGKIPSQDRYQQQLNITVGWHHLDANRHVNNAFYFQWMLESMPKHILEKKSVSQLQIAFKSECNWGDELISETALLHDGSEYIHHIIDSNSGKEVILAKSKWH